MKLVLSAAAVLAWFSAVMLLVAADRYYAPTGLVVTPLMAVVVHAHGATMLGLGTVTWLSRAARGNSLLAVLAGNLVAQFTAAAVVLQASAVLPHNAVLADGSSHGVLAAVFAIALFKSWKFGKRTT